MSAWGAMKAVHSSLAGMFKPLAGGAFPECSKRFVHARRLAMNHSSGWKSPYDFIKVIMGGEDDVSSGRRCLQNYSDVAVSSWDTMPEPCREVMSKCELAGAVGGVSVDREGVSDRSDRVVPPHKCRYVVIDAGLARAGSTMQQELVHQALGTLGFKAAFCNGTKGYWDYPKHMLWNQAASNAYYAKEHKCWSELSNESIVVFKSHEFDSDLLHFCERAIVFTTHRTLVDEVCSAFGAFNLSDVSDDAVLQLVLSLTRAYSAWKAVHPLDLRYEDMASEPSSAYRQVVDYLASSMNITVGQGMLDAVPSMEDEANPNIPSSSGHVNRSAVILALSNARARLRGGPDDPERLGLSWGLSD